MGDKYYKVYINKARTYIHTSVVSVQSGLLVHRAIFERSDNATILYLHRLVKPIVTVVEDKMDDFSRKRKRESKSNYEQHYLYEKNEFGELQGTCLLCEKKKIKRVIKRTHGNTSGLKRHF